MKKFYQTRWFALSFVTYSFVLCAQEIGITVTEGEILLPYPSGGGLTPIVRVLKTSKQ